MLKLKCMLWIYESFKLRHFEGALVNEKNFFKNFTVTDQNVCLPEHLEHEHIVFTWPVFS